ncbi:MAG: response regulator [Solirubrobacteraceae bacterium]
MDGGGPTGIVCDDAPGFRVLMSALLREAGVAITDVGECWEDAERMAPGRDVVVLDLWMPELELDCLARIRAASPRATLAIVTALDLDAAAGRLSAVPVDLLLSKSAPPTEVAACIAAQARAAFA